MPTHIRFSVDGRCRKSTPSSFTIALRPVCSGIGGAGVGVLICPERMTKSGNTAASGPMARGFCTPRATPITKYGQRLLESLRRGVPVGVPAEVAVLAGEHGSGFLVLL